MLIGVISDTHGLLRPEAEQCLGGVDHIIHAGDIGSPDIVPRLAELAPVTAIRGNVDTQPWAEVFPPWAEVFPPWAMVMLGCRRRHTQLKASSFEDSTARADLAAPCIIARLDPEQVFRISRTQSLIGAAPGAPLRARTGGL